MIVYLLSHCKGKGLVLLSLCLIGSFASSQKLRTNLLDTKTTITGDTLMWDVQYYEGRKEKYFYFTNDSSFMRTYSVRCNKLVRGVHTYEDLCYGEYKWSGSCEHFSRVINYTSRSHGIRPFKFGEIKINIKVFNDADSGTQSLFKYTLLDSIGGELDSFYIHLNYSFLKPLSSAPLVQSSPEIKLFPNPTSSSFAIKSSHELTKVEVVNNLGRVVKVFSNLKGKNFNLTDLPKGVYFIKSYGEYGLSFNKLLLQ